MVLLLLCIFAIGEVHGHEHVAYSQSNNLNGGQADWMAQLCDASPITEISLPGTHDSLADDGDGDAVDTQSMNVPNQLAAGIRVFDIRCKRECSDSCLALYHGAYFLSQFFGDVLNDVKAFLNAHPTEFVIMKMQNENDDDSSAEKEIWRDIFEDYYRTDSRWSSYFYTSNTIPTVGDVRKKIVIFRNFYGSGYLNVYDSNLFDIQDDYNMGTNWDLYDKWEKVKAQLNDANNNKSPLKFYVNFLSGSGGSFPYFVASGHSNPATGASRLSTGRTKPAWPDSSWPDFPRTTCTCALCVCIWNCEVCTISFEGTNILAHDHMHSLDFVGIVMMDFPGKGLIDRIISKNYDELANHADCPLPDLTIYCNSPYVPGDINVGQTQTFIFHNHMVQDVTFTDCDSNFDPQLRLYDSGSTTMKNADSGCDGDDCSDNARYPCSTSLRETFTFLNLAIGDYDLKINPYGSGSGIFKVQAFCDLKGTIAIEGTETGTIGNKPEQVYYSLKLDTETPWLTFTDCDTAFDPKLALLDSSFNTISDTACDYDHDDCDDDIHYECNTGYRETFTIPKLDAGRYFVQLTPYYSGGNYDIKVLHAVEEAEVFTVTEKFNSGNHGNMFDIVATKSIRIRNIAFMFNGCAEAAYQFTLYKRKSYGSFSGYETNSNAWEVACSGLASCTYVWNPTERTYAPFNAKTGECKIDIYAGQRQALYLYSQDRSFVSQWGGTKHALYKYNNDLKIYVGNPVYGHFGAGYLSDTTNAVPSIAIVYDRFVAGGSSAHMPENVQFDDYFGVDFNDTSNYNYFWQYILCILGVLVALNIICIVIYFVKRRKHKVGYKVVSMETTDADTDIESIPINNK